MRPAPHPKASTSSTAPSTSDGRPAAAPAGAPGSTPGVTPPAAPSGPFAHKPPKPIGPEALKALREAIKSGKYPSDDAVRSGLERLIRRPE